MCQNPQETATLVTFTEKILKINRRFLCSDKENDDEAPTIKKCNQSNLNSNHSFYTYFDIKKLITFF